MQKLASTQGVFVGVVSDNFDERIQQKFFHAEIVVDNEKIAAETKTYKNIPQTLSFRGKDGTDFMKKKIESNYKQIKSDINKIIETEIDRIKDDPDLQYLISK